MKHFSPKALLLDMDGVLYHGIKALPHAVAFMQALHRLQTPHLFITNNPILLPEEIADKLSTMGFPIPRVEQILTSGVATAEYLSSQKKNFRFYAIGADGLHRVLQQYGTEDQHNADYVVVGEGAGINYEKLAIAIQLIKQNKAQLISTNPDSSVDGICDGKPCVLPGGGALVAPLIIATGEQAITIGKPHPLLFEMALNKLSLKAHECLMIGDRPDTDILGAQQLGINTALVRTGRFSMGEALPNDIHPTFDVGDLQKLSSILSLRD